MKLELQDRNTRDREVPCIVVLNEDGKVIADTLNGDLRSILEERNGGYGARYFDVGSRPILEVIVRIVNVHDELLRALKEMTPPMPARDAACHRGITTQEHCGYCQRVARARAAIAKAEPKP